MIPFTNEQKRKFARIPRPAICFVGENLKGPFTCAEIGVHEAGNAKNMLHFLNIKKIYLIDPYTNYIGNTYYLHADFHKITDIAKAKLEPFKDKIVWIKKMSSDAVSDVPNNLDFVYIDGNHAYEYIKADIENYWPKVRKGGILGGHDYYLTGNEAGVKQAVDDFIKKHNLKLNLKTPDFWIIK